jgi:hypothetical protein
MPQTVECWIREVIDIRSLPTQVGDALCQWKVATNEPASPAGNLNPTSLESVASDDVAWFDNEGEIAVVGECLSRGLELLRCNPAIGAVWLVAANDPWSQLLFQNHPATWASLCLGPANALPVLFRRSVLASVGRLTDLTSPAWNAAVELSARGTLMAAVLPRNCRWDQLSVDRLPPLIPTPPPEPHRARHIVLKVHLPTLAARETSDPCDRAALQSGVWQCQGDLDLSHRLAQEHEGEGTNQLCDYWHAIMHRREPDYSNSKYWFRQVGRHPVFTHLAAQATDLLAKTAPRERSWERRLLRSGAWDPFGMVDLAQAATDDETLAPLARRLQALEMSLLWRQMLGQVRPDGGP